MKTNNIILLADDVMNANLASEPVPLYAIYGFAVQAKYTGTPTGTFKLQASCDPYPYANGAFSGDKEPTNWDDIVDSSYTVSSAGIYIWNFNGAFYNWVRLVYTDASSGASTAIVNAVITVKGA